MKNKMILNEAQPKPQVKNRVKCNACGHDIQVDHFAGIFGGNFYCDAIGCLIILSDRIHDQSSPAPSGRAQESMKNPKLKSKSKTIGKPKTERRVAVQRVVVPSVRIFSGDASVKMWEGINSARTVRDLRMALYVVCCRLQELEENVERAKRYDKAHFSEASDSERRIK